LTHWDDQPLQEKVEIEKKTGAVSWALGPKVTELDHSLSLKINSNVLQKNAIRRSG
jgi:hypothetical protein